MLLTPDTEAFIKGYNHGYSDGHNGTQHHYMINAMSEPQPYRDGYEDGHKDGKEHKPSRLQAEFQDAKTKVKLVVKAVVDIDWNNVTPSLLTDLEVGLVNMTRSHVEHELFYQCYYEHKLPKEQFPVKLSKVDFEYTAKDKQ